MMKKAIISTYCVWNSFGSVLQSLGLQNTLEYIGVKPNNILFKNEMNAPAIRYEKGIIALIKNPFFFLRKKELEKSKDKSIKFINKYINKYEFDNVEELNENCPAADVYIAGSDQIWHPILCRDDFFLEYAPKDKKRISYAASMGTLDIPKENIEKFKKLLSNFDYISVREKEMIPIIKKLTDKSVSLNIDPTFLNSKEIWKKYEKEYTIKEPYILVYALYWDRNYNKQLKELHKKTGYKIVSIQSSKRMIYSNKIICDASPSEFLWLIDNAQAVVTSSFHGTAFSIIFNKKFSVVNNPNSMSRISSVLNILNINTPEPKNVIDKFSVDYKKVNNKIEEEKQRSIDYLINTIGE